MKVFVVGATGVIGRSAVPALLAAGHRVTAVARTAAKVAQLESAGASPVTLDVFDPDALRGALVGHQAVCNLATHIPPPNRAAFGGAWKENDRIRRELSRLVVDAALAAGVERMVQESIALLYADRGADWIDESGEVAATPVTASALEAEGAVARFTEQGGVGVVLRFGLIYGPTNVHTAQALRTARRWGVTSMPGRSEAYLSSIHEADLGTAVAAALGVPPGVWNVVEDEPTTRGEQAQILARAVGRSRLRDTGRLLTAMSGRRLEMMSRSLRVSNRRFREASGWQPSVPSASEGISALARP